MHVAGPRRLRGHRSSCVSRTAKLLKNKLTATAALALPPRRDRAKESGTADDKPCSRACHPMSIVRPGASPRHVVLLELVAELPERHAKELGGLGLDVVR